jgi:hypothetical protein
LANVVKEVLHLAGIDTRIFKSHSLRGASATYAIARGANPNLVKERGLWSAAVFDKHYGRAHQGMNWEALYVTEEEVLRRRHFVESVSSQEANHSCRLMSVSEIIGQEWEDWEETLSLLHASGHLLPISGLNCRTCGIIIRSEASWKCKKCGEHVHFRCLPDKSVDCRQCSGSWGTIPPFNILQRRFAQVVYSSKYRKMQRDKLNALKEKVLNEVASSSGAVSSSSVSSAPASQSRKRPLTSGSAPPAKRQRTYDGS